MKRLVCLMCAIAIVGCGNPMPDMPEYAGEREGVEYYIDAETGLTVDKAHTLVKTAVTAWGEDISAVRGLKVGVLAGDSLECKGGLHTGCYYHDAGVDIIQLTYVTNCSYRFMIGHELWHYFYVQGREPNAEESKQISKVDEAVYALLPHGCNR